MHVSKIATGRSQCKSIQPGFARELKNTNEWPQPIVLQYILYRRREFRMQPGGWLRFFSRGVARPGAQRGEGSNRCRGSPANKGAIYSAPWVFAFCLLKDQYA